MGNENRGSDAGASPVAQGQAAPVHTEFLDAAQGLRHLADEVSSLASAFAETGNKKVANQLWGWADSADALSKKISVATTRMVDERLHESRQASSNMLGIAFALLDPKRATEA
jgi:hypothetical protein